jgi:hypothetical protein
MSPSKEAFIRFVILVDLMCYHHHSLYVSVCKYQLLFSNEERKVLADFMVGYEGGKGRISFTRLGALPHLQETPPARSLSRDFVLTILLYICG